MKSASFTVALMRKHFIGGSPGFFVGLFLVNVSFNRSGIMSSIYWATESMPLESVAMAQVLSNRFNPALNVSSRLTISRECLFVNSFIIPTCFYLVLSTFLRMGSHSKRAESGSIFAQSDNTATRNSKKMDSRIHPRQVENHSNSSDTVVTLLFEWNFTTNSESIILYFW